MNVIKGIRQSAVGKCKGFIKNMIFKDFHQDFLWLQAFPANNVREFAGKMTACSMSSSFISKMIKNDKLDEFTITNTTAFSFVIHNNHLYLCDV